MAHINENYRKLKSGYLFPEIARKTREFQERHPDIEIMRLGIGDTTEPLPQTAVTAMRSKVLGLGSVGYTGYGAEQGETGLREAIAAYYRRVARTHMDVGDVFISDGAKPDTANIGSIFAADSVVAVESPAYPVYVDSNVIAGRTGQFNEDTMQYEGIVYMPCTEENGFFPDVPGKKVDIIYLCRPNNPTGAGATKEQLGKFVEYALDNDAVIIYDVAYVSFINEPDCVKSIYEIEEAKQCAIEIGSFSKIAGFTGVRLGWTVVPVELRVQGSEPGEMRNFWNRRQCTMFNGASNIAQAGGLAVLSEDGQRECDELAVYYMDNACFIKSGLEEIGLTVYGASNAPYAWVKIPGGMKSWDFFDKVLNEAYVVGTPGVGFGPDGEGYFRLSGFGHAENVEDAVASIQANLKL